MRSLRHLFINKINTIKIFFRKNLPFDITTLPTEVLDEVLLQCEHCDYEFESELDLLAHKKQIHQSPSKESTLLERYVTFELQLTIIK